MHKPGPVSVMPYKIGENFNLSFLSSFFFTFDLKNLNINIQLLDIMQHFAVLL